MHRVDVHLCAISFRARRMFSCLTEPLAVNLRKQQPVCQQNLLVVPIIYWCARKFRKVCGYNIGRSKVVGLQVRISASANEVSSVRLKPGSQGWYEGISMND